MRRKVWSHAVLGLMALAGAFAVATPSAHSQMCTPAIRDCESQADAEARRCSLQCTRYDTICTDRCDDTHDIVVHYCWIKQALCKATADPQGFRKASNQHD